VTLRGEVKHEVKLLFGKKLINTLRVGDIEPRECDSPLVDKRGYIFNIPGVGKEIECGDLPLRSLSDQVVHQIATDKSGGAGYKNLHRGLPNI
jgi:hypothetical protein